MTNTKLKALRAAFNSFSEIQKQIAQLQFGNNGVIEAIHGLVQQANKTARGVLPSLTRYVATALSVLSTAIEDEGSIMYEIQDCARFFNVIIANYSARRMDTG